MKIVSLQTENVKRVKAVEIIPSGDTVVIGGKNAAGKTSVIDSIVMALGGMDYVPERPIRDGEEGAKIVIDLGDFTVTRHWTATDKSYLAVKTKEGAVFPGPQKMLDGLVGKLSFDPLAFTQMDAKARVKVLKDLAKLDFATLDRELAIHMEQRKEWKRDGEKLKARLEGEFKDLVEVDAVPDIEQIREAKDQAYKINEGIAEAKLKAQKFESAKAEAAEEINFLKAKIKELQDDLYNAQAELVQMTSAAEEIAAIANQQPEDVSKYDAATEAHYAYQSYLNKKAVKDKVEAEVEKARAAWHEEDAAIKLIEKTKIEMVENADMPVKGLALGDGDILYNNIPFAQLSQAEQIKISMAISIAMNPKLKIALIYNGSLLDNDTMAQIAEIAKRESVQVWIERVMDTPDGNCFYIEDGEVLTAEAEPKAKPKRTRKSKAEVADATDS